AIALMDATNAGGVGTSSLVARAARQARAAGGFADGIAVLSCVGHRDALDLLRAVLARFDPEERQPEARDSQGLAVAAGALLDGKHPLIVLEDAPWELSLSTITRPLVAAGATVVVTGPVIPSTASTPPEATPPVQPLPPDAALALFTQMYTQTSTIAQATPRAAPVERIVNALARQPLAISLVAAHAASEQRTLATLADALQTDGRG